MALIVILTLTGIMLGATGSFGWLTGGILGALVAQIILLVKRIKRLENDVQLLRAQRTAPVSIKEVSKEVDTQKEAAAMAAVDITGPVIETSVPEANIPLTGRTQVQQPELTDPADSHLSESMNTQPEAATPESVISQEQAASRASAEQKARVDDAVQPPLAPSVSPVATVIDGFFEKIVTTINRFFTQGNPIVRIGMVVMFFGLAFLVKYAAGEGLIPLELRLASVAVIALALLVLGWKTRAKPDGYGLVLQGGGIAALYLTVFAALKLYALLPPGVALLLMLVMVMLGALLAVLQNAQVLALIATAGGFLAPILTSDGSGSHVALFSFYLLLNIGILAIAWFKTWRLLNWVGFVFTFVITSVWGVLEYQPQFYTSTQPFLIAFFALYLTVAILFSLKQPPKLTGLVDGSLVFGLPIVAFGLQTALLKHTEYGLAISSLVLSAIYTLLARVLWVKFQNTQRVLAESMTALGVTFATLAIPLALDAEWTSASWALEATGLIWVGLRQRRLLARYAGYVLYIGAVASLFRDGSIETGATPIFSGDFISLVLLSLSGLIIAWLLQRFAEACTPVEKSLELIALMIGWIWWLTAGLNEIDAHISSDNLFAAVLLFLPLSCLALLELSRKLQWQTLAYTGYWLLPMAGLWLLGSFFVTSFGDGSHPLHGLGAFGLAAFLVVQYRFLRTQENRARYGLIGSYHALTAWLIIALIFWEADWWQRVNGWQDTSSMVLWFGCIALPLIVLMRVIPKTFWPLTTHQHLYKNIVPAPLVFMLLLWFFEACRHSGATAFGYVTVFNPLDLAQLAAIVLLAYTMKSDLVNMRAASRELRCSILGAAVFISLNVMLLRTVHHFGDVVYSATWLWNSSTVQMGLSILWTLSALIIMHLSRRIKDRRLWMVGVGLLAIVVIKLFTQDLGSDTLARVVSFMVVGGLILLIGYFSPIPAKTPSALKKEDVQNEKGAQNEESTS